MLRWYQVFLITLAGGLIIQTWIWRVDSFTDESLWEKRIEQLRRDLKNPSRLDAWNPLYSGHPGMATVSLGVLVGSLSGAVVLLNSVSIAAAAAITSSLRPQSLWWLALAATATLHPLYAYVTPTNAVIGPLVLICTVSFIWLYERPDSPAARSIQALLALAAGVGLASRLETMGIVLGCIVLALWRKIGWRNVAWIGTAAAMFAIMIDPLWWFAPVEHLSFILFRSHLNFTPAVHSHSLTLLDFAVDSPLGLVSLALALTSRSFSRALLLNLIGITIIFCLLLLRVRAQSLRHFFPIILLWEALLPIFVWDLLHRYRVAQVVALVLIVFSQSFLLWRALL